MFFEDEKDKDIIIDPDANLEISDDGTVSWDDILVDNDEIVSIKDSNKTHTQQNNNAVQNDSKTVGADSLGDDLIDLGDDLEFIDDETDNTGDVDDEELRKILTADSSTQAPKQKAFDAFGGNSGQNQAEIQNNDSLIQEDFDIDSNLANAAEAAGIANNNLRNKAPRSEIKIAKNSQKSSLPLLIAILVAVVAGGGVYYYTSSYSDEKEMLADLTAQNQAVQETLNNTTQEEIANRVQDEQNNAIPVVNEEQANTLQAQKEQQQKETVPVMQTGRNDPFMPLEKYTTFVIEKPKPKAIAVQKPKKTKNIDDFGFPVPPRFLNNAENAYMNPNELNKLDSFLVSGILYDTKNPAAIINYDGASYFIKEGDIFKDFVIKKIERDFVVLAHGKYIFRAKVADEINSQNKNITPKGLISAGNKRVYPLNVKGDTNSDNDKKENAHAGTRNNNEYVSEDEIEVNER